MKKEQTACDSQKGMNKTNLKLQFKHLKADYELIFNIIMVQWLF